MLINFVCIVLSAVSSFCALPSWREIIDTDYTDLHRYSTSLTERFATIAKTFAALCVKKITTKGTKKHGVVLMNFEGNVHSVDSSLCGLSALREKNVRLQTSNFEHPISQSNSMNSSLRFSGNAHKSLA